MFEHRDLYLGARVTSCATSRRSAVSRFSSRSSGKAKPGTSAGQLAAAGLVSDGLIEAEDWSTPRKLRVHAGQHALVRIDFERPRSEDRRVDAALEDALARLSPGCQGAVVSDYRKGTVTEAGVERLKQTLGDAPVRRGSKAYARSFTAADFLLPNERELAFCSGASGTTPAPNGCSSGSGSRRWSSRGPSAACACTAEAPRGTSPRAHARSST